VGESRGRQALVQTSLWFGGDYNPGQWPSTVIDDDLVLLERLGANTVTLPVFGWELLHPAKDRFEFGWLDRVLERLADREFGVIMATPTAAQPAWMSAAYTEILPVDTTGRRRRHGGRGNYCPTSTAYLEASAEIASVLAERYREYAGLRLWHVNNEYGPVCFCDGCRSEFASWLAARYGDLDGLNEAWGTTVWGNTLRDWSEIELPSSLNSMGTTPEGVVNLASNPSAALDHARFVSASLLRCYLNERSALRSLTPAIPITTNFHGPIQAVDWHEWGPHIDLVSWDSYPRAGSPWSHASFGHDLARGAGAGDEFLVMESSPGSVSWHDRCPLKRPGVVRLEALQAIARGSRGALFFQVRQSRAGAELQHAALIPRHGRIDTRVGTELARLGGDLSSIEVLQGTHRIARRVAVVFDWPSWWAHHNTPGLDQRSRYFDTVRAFHGVLAERGLTTDVVGVDATFDSYDVVVAPLLHIVGPSTARTFAEFVAGGGLLISTCGSAIVIDDGRVHARGVEPIWQQLFGLWIEETDVQPEAVVNRVVFDDGTTAAARELFDVVRLDTADVVATFTDDFYAGSPAITTNWHGDGRAVYLASPSAELFAAVIGRLSIATDAPPVADGASVEVVRWESDSNVVAFCLNHGTVERTIDLGDGEWTDLLTGSSIAGSTVVAARDAVVARRTR